ncbi:hypothetical protein NDU88_001764 [Pleurodeles waltl]|uniref:Uncharacterized protein n=1 Tax=Pleurodeles waltl TaxID=8319 RepID=A0AAV7RDY0_PLEWA|nr:hypothetical protein NDU88_001764 [Pleurodeles waltl]
MARGGSVVPARKHATPAGAVLGKEVTLLWVQLSSSPLVPFRIHNVYPELPWGGKESRRCGVQRSSRPDHHGFY